MSDIAPIHSSAGFTSPSAVDTSSAAAPPSSRSVANEAPAQPSAPRLARASDEATISEQALLLSRIRDLPEIRQELVDRVRNELARNADAFETPEKLEIAAERLGEELDLFG